MKGIKAGYIDGVAKSSFIAVIDPQRCDYCGDCFTACNVKAIRLAKNNGSVDKSKRVSSIKKEICLGCGACITACEKNAISLIPREKYTIPKSSKRELFKAVLKEKGRLRPYVIYEIKSIDPSKFKGTYIKEHLFQGIIYAYILKTEYDYDIDNVTIVYVLRDLKTIQAFDVKIDMKLAESFLARAPILLSALEANTVPEPIGATKDQCRWCPYKKFCEDDGYSKLIPPYKKTKQKKKPPPTQPQEEKPKQIKKKAPEAKFLL